MRALWARRAGRESLEPAERSLLDILEEHDEFRAIWDGQEPGEDENPFLHVSMHELLEKQIASDDPPGTRAALDRLVAKGETRHDAIHTILRVLIHELYQMTQGQRSFDHEGYKNKLEKLGRG